VKKTKQKQQNENTEKAKQSKEIQTKRDTRKQTQERGQAKLHGPLPVLCGEEEHWTQQLDQDVEQEEVLEEAEGLGSTRGQRTADDAQNDEHGQPDERYQPTPHVGLGVLVVTHSFDHSFCTNLR